MRVSIRNAEGEHVTTVATLPGAESFVLRQGQNTTVTSLPLAHRGLVAGGGDRIVLATSDSYRVEYRDRRGSLDRVIEAPVVAAELTEEVAADFKAREAERLRQLGFYERMREKVDAKYERLPLGRPLPVIADVSVSRDGRLWVLLSSANQGRQMWAVHGADGRLESTVRLPGGVQLMDVGSDWLLGTFTDELEVQYVGLWQLSATTRR